MLVWLWKQLSDCGPGLEISGRSLRPFPEADVERLLRSRVLVEQAKIDVWPVCRHCDCGYDARPVRFVDAQLRACCPQDVTEDALLEPDDLRRFRIDADKLAWDLAGSGELSGCRGRVADGIWLLGATASGRRIVLCAGLRLLEAPGAILAIKASAGTTAITLITTKADSNMGLRLYESGIEARVLADCVVADGAGMERLMVDRLVQVVEPHLIILRQSHRVILSGGEIEIPQQPFKLLVMLAEAVGRQPGYLTPQQIEAENSGRSAADLVRDLRKALGDHQRQLIKTRFNPSGYFLALPAGAFALRS